MAFPADHQAAEVVEPSKQAFHMPPAPVPAERAPILSLPTVTAIRRNHLDAKRGKVCVECIAVVGSVTDQPFGVVKAKSGVKSVLDQRDLVWAGAGNVNGDGEAAGVCDRHDLRPLAALRLSHVEAPFFALAKVASMKHSLRLSCPWSASISYSACKTRLSTPERVHS